MSIALCVSRRIFAMITLPSVLVHVRLIQCSLPIPKSDQSWGRQKMLACNMIYNILSLIYCMINPNSREQWEVKKMTDVSFVTEIFP